MQSLKEMIAKQKQKQSSKNWLIRVHHTLMKEYGWIPLDEFKKLPMPTIFGLMEEINKDREKERKESEKLKR